MSDEVPDLVLNYSVMHKHECEKHPGKTWLYFVAACNGIKKQLGKPCLCMGCHKEKYNSEV